MASKIRFGEPRARYTVSWGVHLAFGWVRVIIFCAWSKAADIMQHPESTATATATEPESPRPRKKARVEVVQTPLTVEDLLADLGRCAAENLQTRMGTVQNHANITELLDEQPSGPLPVEDVYAIVSNLETETDIADYGPEDVETQVHGVHDPDIKANVLDTFHDCPVDDFVYDTIIPLASQHDAGTVIHVTVVIAIEPKSKTSTVVVYGRVEEEE